MIVKTNRIQTLVLGFFLVVWTTLVVLLAAAPGVYDAALRLPAGAGKPELATLAGLTLVIALLAVGVFRRWRWLFWIILAAFLSGVLRVPAAILQLTGALDAPTPAWYALFQALLGMIQFVIGLLMLAAYRRAGVWGPSPRRS